jgi:hypothetical protein
MSCPRCENAQAGVSQYVSGYQNARHARMKGISASAATTNHTHWGKLAAGPPLRLGKPASLVFLNAA